MFGDIMSFEFCFPGSVLGHTDFNCPGCGSLLNLEVSDPMGVGRYRCDCGQLFDVDWLDYEATLL